MLGFSHPWLLWLIAVIPVLLFFVRRAEKKKLKKLHESVHPQTLQRLFPENEKSCYKLKQILFILALGFMILASAGLRVGSGLKELKQEGLDVIAAVDLSTSMTATDIAPSRLDRAKYEVKRLISMLRGDRIGLVGFAGVSHLQCPVTSDYRTASMMLELMDKNLIPVQGTAFADALSTAINAFPDKESSYRAIILISDGEDHEQDIDKVIEEARNKKILIYTLGIGTISGSPIPIYNSHGDLTDYKRDNSGSVINSKLQEQVLRRIANSTGGKYYRLGAVRNPIESIYNEILHGDKNEYQTHEFARYTEMYLIFAWIAFILLMAAFFWPETRKSKTS